MELCQMTRPETVFLGREMSFLAFAIARLARLHTLTANCLLIPVLCLLSVSCILLSPSFHYSLNPLLLHAHLRIMPSQFLALVGVSLFDPETASRSRRRETRRPNIK